MTCTNTHKDQLIQETQAREDPVLKGYFTTRHRYVDDQHRTMLFNSIGEVLHPTSSGHRRCTLPARWWRVVVTAGAFVER